jgi:osmotically-inducible protein OsmY
MKNTKITIAVLIISGLSGCWGVAAGAGAEAAYVLTQEKRTAGETLSDQSTTASIKTRLLADSEVSGLNINVDTFKGRVTLKGVVGSRKEAEKAIEIAKNTSDIRTVESKLVVIE